MRTRIDGVVCPSHIIGSVVDSSSVDSKDRIVLEANRKAILRRECHIRVSIKSTPEKTPQKVVFQGTDEILRRRRLKNAMIISTSIDLFRGIVRICQYKCVDVYWIVLRI